MSAATTPTSVTSGRSSPLAIICVPISTSASWATNSVQDRVVRALRAGHIAIPAQRARPGNSSLTASSTFSVPLPK